MGCSVHFSPLGLSQRAVFMPPPLEELGVFVLADEFLQLSPVGGLAEGRMWISGGGSV